MKYSLLTFLALALCSLFAEMEPATPESQGVDSQSILNFIDAAERAFDGASVGSTKGHLHGFVIVRYGKVIAEGSWKPFDTLNETHMLYSHSKSFTSSAIGFLADEGKIDLDERIVDIFTNDLPANVSENLRQLRVRDLLTMNVGADKDHTIAKNSNDWAKWFMRKELQHRPGTGFKYDSDATYMLAAIVEKKSGMKLMDYLKVKMFDPIGITKAWSTTSPEGIACGGWGMNMTTREMARFGLLYLQNGQWEGRHVLSPYWCQLATARHTWSGWQNVGVKALGEGSDWEQGYGFQFWRCRHGAYRADGAAGQYTVVVPDKDLVISAHAGLNNFQKHLDLIWNNLLPALKDAPLPENPGVQKRLAERLAKLEIPPVRWDCSSPIDWQKKFDLKENARGFKSVSFEAVNPKTNKANGAYMPSDRPRVLCRIETRAGEQMFVAEDGAWMKGGKIRIDTENYESLGAYIGEHAVAASCGVQAGPIFRLRAYLTGTTGYLDFSVDKSGKLTGRFWAMNGCKLESVD